MVCTGVLCTVDILNNITTHSSLHTAGWTKSAQPPTVLCWAGWAVAWDTEQSTLWETFRGQRTARLVVLEREDWTVLYPVASQHVTARDIPVQTPPAKHCDNKPSPVPPTPLTSKLSALSQQSLVTARY